MSRKYIYGSVLSREAEELWAEMERVADFPRTAKPRNTYFCYSCAMNHNELYIVHNFRRRCICCEAKDWRKCRPDNLADVIQYATVFIKAQGWTIKKSSSALMEGWGYRVEIMPPQTHPTRKPRRIYVNDNTPLVAQIGALKLVFKKFPKKPETGRAVKSVKKRAQSVSTAKLTTSCKKTP